jgi:hypothetical protein
MTVSLVMAGTVAETVPALKAATALQPGSLAKCMRPFVTAIVAVAIFCRMRDATCQRIGNLQIYSRSEYVHEPSDRACKTAHGSNKWLIGRAFYLAFKATNDLSKVGIDLAYSMAIQRRIPWTQ